MASGRSSPVSDAGSRTASSDECFGDDERMVPPGEELEPGDSSAADAATEEKTRAAVAAVASRTSMAAAAPTAGDPSAVSHPSAESIPASLASKMRPVKKRGVAYSAEEDQIIQETADQFGPIKEAWEAATARLPARSATALASRWCKFLKPGANRSVRPVAASSAGGTDPWVQCERCDKWRRLPQGAAVPAEDDNWWRRRALFNEGGGCAWLSRRATFTQVVRPAPEPSPGLVRRSRGSGRSGREQ